jgi:hypothetical protein
MLEAHAIQDLVTQERSGGSWLEASLGKKFTRPYLEKEKHHKKWLVEWLKVQALSSSPSTTKIK